MYYYKRIVHTPYGQKIEYFENDVESLASFNIKISEEEYFEAMNVPLLEKEIADLRYKLATTDYIACKIAEGSATKEEYAEQIAERKNIRSRINEIELELNSNECHI